MLETYYRILKHDPKGRLIEDSGLIPSGSYVIQFLELVEAFNAQVSKNAKDVDGADSVLIDVTDDVETKGRVDAAVGDDTYGVVVGTNDTSTAEDNENFKLDTKILHSAIGAADKLNYQAVTLVDARVVGVNIDLDVSRGFLNEHETESITVKEIGIICKNSTDTKYHLLLRDVLTVEEEETVAPGYTLTVVYTLRTTV